MTNQERPAKSQTPALTRILGWVFFVLAFLGAYFLVRWLMAK